MVITATEFKVNIGYYLNAISKGEIFITKHGKIVAKLSNPAQNKQKLLDSLVGLTAKNPVSLEKAKKERLARQ